MGVNNTLTYFDMELITTVKYFIQQGPACVTVKTYSIKWLCVMFVASFKFSFMKV
jgi:hypothetical protein